MSTHYERITAHMKALGRPVSAADLAPALGITPALAHTLVSHMKSRGLLRFSHSETVRAPGARRSYLRTYYVLADNAAP